MADRRAEFRRKSYLGGRMGYMARSLTPHCLVRNISPGGAKLAFNSPPLLSTEFDLVIYKHGTHRARLVWHLGAQAGVAFVD